MPFHIITGDITQQEADAIVNSANPSMLAGSGVSGAIHKAAGKELEQECRIIGHVNAGHAALTAGYALKARYVIHAVAPQWFGGQNREEEYLLKCYQSIFGIIEMEKFHRVCFPAIGIGTYRWPIDKAAPITISQINEFLQHNTQVTITLVCSSQAITEAYKEYLK